MALKSNHKRSGLKFEIMLTIIAVMDMMMIMAMMVAKMMMMMEQEPPMYKTSLMCRQ